MSLPSPVAHYRITSKNGEAMNSPFPRWLNREAGKAEAVIEWS